MDYFELISSRLIKDSKDLMVKLDKEKNLIEKKYYMPTQNITNSKKNHDLYDYIDKEMIKRNYIKWDGEDGNE